METFLSFDLFIWATCTAGGPTVGSYGPSLRTLFALEAVSVLLILKGLQGFLQNTGLFISYMISGEAIFIGIAIRYMIVSLVTGEGSGLTYSIIIVIILAAESAIGLALLYGTAISLGLLRTRPVGFIRFI